MSDQFADWLEAAGAKVARAVDGSVPFGIEISPLYALDAGELKAKITPGMVVNGPHTASIVPTRQSPRDTF